MKNLKNQFNNHEYPAVVFKFPNLLRLIHFLENFTRLKNWYIHKQLKKLIENSKESFSWIDIGSGSGVFTYPYSRKNLKAKFVCADVNPNNNKIIQRLVEQNSLLNLTAEKFDLNNDRLNTKYDVILCISTLELIKDDIKALINIKKGLTTEGKFLLYLPTSGKRALPFFNYLYYKLFQDVNYSLSNKRQHIYTRKSIEQKLNDAGFRIVESKITYGFFGKLHFEISMILEMTIKKVPVFIVPFVLIIFVLIQPLQMLLMILDYYTKKTDGNGFLVIAKQA